MSYAQMLSKGLESDTKIKPQKKSLPSKPYLIDIGSNLTYKKIKPKLPDVLNRARKARVEKQIITGCTLKESQEALKLAQHHPTELYSTAGIHPHYAKTYSLATEKELEKLLANREVVAVGESGLDYNRMLSTQEEQIASFKAHIMLAIKHRKPMFLHERDAHTDFINTFEEVLEELDLGWDNLPSIVVHCFTGKEEEMLTYLDKGFYIGITGFIGMEKRGSYLRRFVKKIPPNRLMIETDAPYMKPDGAPNQPTGSNEPCNLPYVAEIIAKILHVPPFKVWEATTQNAKTFFNI